MSDEAQKELEEFLTTHPDRVDLDIQVINNMFDRYKTNLAQLKYDRTILEMKMKSQERFLRTEKQKETNPMTGKSFSRDVAEDLAYINADVTELREKIAELDYDIEVFEGHCKAIEMKNGHLSGFQGRQNRQLGMER